MPLIAHNDLPSYSRLAAEGQGLISHEPAMCQDTRELHIGLLNMMPDAALEATERQFLRLVGASNSIAQFYVHLFTVDGLERGETGREHIAKYYERFDDIAESGLDALIITGANISGPDLTREAFFQPMTHVIDWAKDHVTSTLCSCLASHAVWRYHHGIERRRMSRKLWGVFEHHTVTRHHPMVSGINTRFNAPHSRYNDVSRAQLEGAGLSVLTESEDAGVLLATSGDGLQFVFLQGHPEYDTQSLAKEFKREVMRYLAGQRKDFPACPSHYFNADAQAVIDQFRHAVAIGEAASEYPERRLNADLDNTWIDTGKSIFNNWLGRVFEATGTRPCLPSTVPDSPNLAVDTETSQPTLSITECT